MWRYIFASSLSAVLALAAPSAEAEGRYPLRSRQSLPTDQRPSGAPLTAQPGLAVERAPETARPSVQAPSQQSFVPSFSLIVDAGYLSRDHDDDLFGSLGVPGFAHEHNGEGGHAHGLGERGFNLNYGELTMFSAVDPYFDLTGIFHLTTDSFEIEEAYATTRSLPSGVQVKAGKFLSSFGRINSQHAHAWDFADRPLVFDLMFGPEGINDTGAQLNWLAPVSGYLSLGIEAFNGGLPEALFARDAFAANIEGEERSIEKRAAPNLVSVFAKASGDVGGVTLLGGVSHAFGRAQVDDGEDALDAATRVTGVDFTAKYYFDPYRYLAWQSEYLDRDITGDIYSEGEDGVYTAVAPIEQRQAGWYSQLGWRAAREFALGARYEAVTRNSVSEDGEAQDIPDGLTKVSAMLQYNFSEFSYARLQYNHDRTKFLDGERTPVMEVLLQLNFLIGAHPAHLF